MVGALPPPPITLPGFPTPLIDVRAAPYFADATGVTDATAQLQEAVALLGAAGGGTLFLAGTYQLTDTLTLPRGVSLQGVASSAEAATGVWPQNVYPAVLQWGGALGGIMLKTEDYWAGHIEHLTLDGASLAQGLLWLDRSPRGGTFRDLLLRRSLAGGGGAALMLQHDETLFPAALNYFERICVVETGAKALVIDGATLNTFIGCSFTSNNDDTVVIATPAWSQPGQGGSDDNMFFGGFIQQGGGFTAVVHNYAARPVGGYLNNFFGVAIATEIGSTAIGAANNDNYSYHVGCYLSCCGTPYDILTDGKIKLIDCQFGTPSGKESLFLITPTGSPYTYTNDKPYLVSVHLYGGVVSVIELGRNGAFAAVGDATARTLLLEPGDAVRVTYADAPFMSGQPH
jgi:hypothetical protein